MNGEDNDVGRAVSRDWTSARLDIVNGLLRMADEALTARQATAVLRMAHEAQDAGLLTPEEASHITLIADARIRWLARED
jgi:hypothetical protein